MDQDEKRGQESERETMKVEKMSKEKRTLEEIAREVSEADADCWRRAIPAIDCITRILGEVKPEVIEAIPEVGRAAVRERLRVEMERWSK